MLYFEYLNLKKAVVHYVGNKICDDGVVFSDELLPCSNEFKRLFLNYTLRPFAGNEAYCNLFHEADIRINLVYDVVSKIFDNPEALIDLSKILARHLYERSTHPKIKGGEFYTVYFEDCIINGETVDAVGLFKSENKDTFLKVFRQGKGFEIESEKGININKLDKGCLIFNTERENGYIVAVVDNTSKGVKAQYWTDDFLHVRQRKDAYYNTQNIISLTKNFIKNKLPQQFEVSGADKADLINKAVKFFKEKDSFNLEEFTHEVIGQPDVIEKFNQYKSSYAQEYDVDFADNFTISGSVVKKQARVLKNIIKLDKNFSIHIHGNHQELIEQGMDEKGKFYKVYYKDEL